MLRDIGRRFFICIIASATKKNRHVMIILSVENCETNIHGSWDQLCVADY